MCYSGFYLFILSGSEGRLKKRSQTPKGFQNKSTHPQRQTKQKTVSGEEGDLAVGVTPLGRGGFLSSICCSHFTVTTVYLYNAVMFGISLEGEPQPLFSLERGGNQRVSVCRLRFLDQFLIIADKHSLVSSSRNRGGGGAGGDALVIRMPSCRRRVD